MTITNSEDPGKQHITYLWDGSEEDSRAIGCLWTGETRFTLKPDEPPPRGFTFVDVRKIRIQNVQKGQMTRGQKFIKI